MPISTNSNFWTARTNGSNPASPVGSNNDAWSLSGSGSDGSATSGYWRISGSGQTWSITPSALFVDLSLYLRLQMEQS